MVTIAAPVGSSSSVPRTTAVSAVAVLRSPDADAMFPLKLVVPWEHVDDVARVRLAVAVPEGFVGEVVLVEPAYVLAETQLLPAPATGVEGAHIRIAIEAEVESAGPEFSCGVKFPDQTGSFGAAVGVTGERLCFEAYSRVYCR